MYTTFSGSSLDYRVVFRTWRKSILFENTSSHIFIAECEHWQSKWNCLEKSIEKKHSGSIPDLVQVWRRKLFENSLPIIFQHFWLVLQIIGNETLYSYGLHQSTYIRTTQSVFFFFHRVWNNFNFTSTRHLRNIILFYLIYFFEISNKHCRHVITICNHLFRLRWLICYSQIILANNHTERKTYSIEMKNCSLIIHTLEMRNSLVA